MKKTFRVTSLLLICFLFIQIFSFFTYAINYDELSYRGMLGTLIPGWYYQYHGSVHDDYATTIDFTADYTYITHFFSYSCHLDCITNNYFTDGTYYISFYPANTSIWWNSFNADPLEPNDMNTVYLTPPSTLYIMEPNTYYTRNNNHNDLFCFNLDLSEEGYFLARAIVDVSLRNNSTNIAVASETIFVEHDEYHGS